MLDQISLLAAIGFSSAALCITLLLAWASARRDGYLLSWCVGMGLIVVGVLVYGVLGSVYVPALHLAAFMMLIVGFAVVLGGAQQYVNGRADWRLVSLVAGGGVLATAVPFALGYAGLGTIAANVAMALPNALAAERYWAGRAETRLPLVSNALLYGAAALSFLLCGSMLASQGQLVLNALPVNWAEDVNGIVLIICVTGIGAVSLTLNQSRAARRHERAANTDGLTGLLNRRALFDRFGSEPCAPGLALILLDLDHFKAINDRFGHAAGDAVLRRFAQVVGLCAVPDNNAARLGGEEFCVLLPFASSAAAKYLAERLRSEFGRVPVATERGDILASVSAGLAVSSQGENFDSLMNRADAALYLAKEKGRNQVQTAAVKLVA